MFDQRRLASRCAKVGITGCLKPVSCVGPALQHYKRGRLWRGAEWEMVATPPAKQFLAQIE
jgi:hypothetical protein